jgi:hypothetical protein
MKCSLPGKKCRAVSCQFVHFREKAFISPVYPSESLCFKDLDIVISPVIPPVIPPLISPAQIRCKNYAVKRAKKVKDFWEKTCKTHFFLVSL